MEFVLNLCNGPTNTNKSQMLQFSEEKSFGRPTGSAKGLLVPWNLTAGQAKMDS